MASSTTDILTTDPAYAVGFYRSQRNVLGRSLGRAVHEINALARLLPRAGTEEQNYDAPYVRERLTALADSLSATIADAAREPGGAS